MEKELRIPEHALKLNVAGIAVDSAYFALVPKDGDSIAVCPGTSDRSCVVVGRNEVCDHRIDHKSISRKHFALFLTGSTGSTGLSAGNAPKLHILSLSAADKKPGIYLNDEAVTGGSMKTLGQGDILRFGKYKVEYIVSISNEERGWGGGVELEDEAAVAPAVAPAVVPAVIPPVAPAVIPPVAPAPRATTREEREKEINEMVNSFSSDVPLTYTKYENDDGDNDNDNDNDNDGGYLGPASSMRSITSDFRSLSLPLTTTSTLMGHSKPTTALAFDNSGNRLAAGSSDQTVRLYDFGGMTSDGRPFKEFVVDEGHPVVSISYSPTGSNFLVATASAQPKVFDRDGNEVIQFVKGDVYVATDSTRTTGHIAAVSDGVWTSAEKNECLTTSIDCTLRLWDLGGKTNFKKLCNMSVANIKNSGSRKIKGTR